MTFGQPRKRQTHIYNVGMAKSGTKSIAHIFKKHIRSAHEPESARMAKVILKYSDRKIKKEDVKRILLKRDKRLLLDLDSSQLNFFLISELMSFFPEAKFLLTMRHPYDWLDSYINHQISQPIKGVWVKMRDFRFRPDLHTHSSHEATLKKHALYTLDGYLSYWANHNQTVLDAIPEDKLLVVRTNEINKKIEKILSFMDVSCGDFGKGKTHFNKGINKYDILESIDKTYLLEKIDAHFSPLVEKYFV